MIPEKIGCIFDMDGVLFLSSEIHYQAYCEALAAEPVEVLDYRELSGMRTDSAIQKIFNKSGIVLNPEKLQELVSRKRESASEMLRKQPPVAPDCNKVLAEFYRRDIPLALASSSSSQNVQLFLESSGTRNYFSVILSGDDVKNAKPDQEIFRTSRNCLGIQPEFCFVVEDSENGILGAKADGMKVIGVIGQHTKKELQIFGTVATISRLDDLLQLSEFQSNI